MQTKDYTKQCNVERLSQEIEAVGLPQHPKDGARFYGVTSVVLPDASWLTTVLFYDDITAEEISTVDGVVDIHVPTPIIDPEEPHDAENKPFVRAESRPLSCTTCFTTCGDLLAQGSIPPMIGGGNRLEWDASDGDQWSTDGAPDGMKQRKVTIQFCDSIWLKEGTVYFNNGKKGSYVDMEVICPHGGYYMYLGEVMQNLTGDDLVVNHYVIKSPIDGDAPMGDELNTETCSEEIPSYMKFRMTVTVPTSDVDSYGSVQMEVYRKRTVVV